MATLTETSANVPVWTIGDRLAKSRLHAGIKTAKEMSRRAGVDEKTIRNWESGGTRVTHAVCVLYSDITGVPVQWIEGPNYSGDQAMRASRCTHAPLTAA